MTDTLPHDWYHNPEIYALECEHVFRKHWWLIGPETQFSNNGDYLALQLMRWPLLILRDQNSQLRGFFNLCRHRAGPLADEGNGQCRELVCRYHGWRYACSGELLKTPNFGKENPIEREQMGLLPIRVGCWNGLVFVCLDSSAPDLSRWLGDIVTIAEGFPQVNAMQFDNEVIKTGNANWKTYGDNSCEGYHVGMVHKTLGSSMLRESVSIDNYENGEFVGFDVNYSAEGEDQSRAGKGFWIYKFPGLLLHFADFTFNAESVIPLSADTLELRRWFWADEKLANERNVDTRSILPNSAQVMDEDIAICERVQRNLSCGEYPGGELSKTQESGTAYFQQLVRRAIAEHL